MMESKSWLNAKEDFRHSLDSWYEAVKDLSNDGKSALFWQPLMFIVGDCIENTGGGKYYDEIEYSRDDLECIKEDLPDYEYCMPYVHDAIYDLKKALPVIYHNLFYRLSNWETECENNGWDWQGEERDVMLKQQELTRDLTNQFLKLYAMVEKATVVKPD